MSIEDFKKFVKTRPELIDYVRKKEESWQGFYNMYELYGEKNDIWDKYKKSSSISIKDFLSNFKNIDTNALQKSITSIRKGLSYVSSLIAKDTKDLKKTTYKPSPIHKRFDD